LAAAMAGGAAQAQTQGTIKIGVLHSLSGTMAISETSLKDVALMTIDEINAKGGVLGKKIEPVVVEGDRMRLERVLQNIIGNAVKYSPAGTPIQVRVEQQDYQANITVRDSGVGIPADELPHIFTRYYRASTSIGIKGTGIGLAGSRTIVMQHGGHISLDSGVDRGTTVVISLPCLQVPGLLRAPVSASAHDSEAQEPRYLRT